MAVTIPKGKYGCEARLIPHVEDAKVVVDVERRCDAGQWVFDGDFEIPVDTFSEFVKICNELIEQTGKR